MIIIYSPTETNFISDGLGVIDPITINAEITEELNGAFYLELTAAIDHEGRFELLQHDNIIKANGQLFRVLDVDKDTDFISVKALHIFYDLNNNFLEDVAPTDKSCGDALNWILDRTQYTTPFIGSSDISNINTARYVRKNVTEAIMGDLPNSILKLWGGELRRHNYSIEILNRLGAENGVEISYGKNITGIEETIYKNNVITRIMPQGFNGLLLPEKYVDSAHINSYPMPVIRKIEFPEIKVNDDPDYGEIVTAEQAYQQLRDEAQKLYDVNKVDLPLVNFKINFIDLTQTEEYKNYKVLEAVSLGDTVKVEYKRLKVDISARVIKTVWDVLAERYSRIELGNFDQNLRKYINQIATVVQDTAESKYLDAIEAASQLIRSGFGGYVVKTRDELLIMDTEDTETAQHVWRWNINGLGFSSTGYNGTYGLAMTMDGKINADFIKAGKVQAEYINADYLSAISASFGTMTAGKIQDETTGSFWDLDNGIINLNVNELKINSVDVAGQIAEVKQTAEGVETTVSNLKVGGNNFLQGTSRENKSLTVGTYTTAIAAAIYIDDTSLKHGEEISLRLYLEAPNTYGGRARLSFYRSDGTYSTATGNLISGGDEGYTQLTAVIPSDCEYIRAMIQNENAGGVGSVVNYREAKLEKGNIFTDWAPSPEDVEGKITTVQTNLDGVVIDVNEYKAGKLYGSTYSFTGSSFDIGGQTGDIAKHSNAESRYNHSDGSYTKISTNGMERYIAGNAKKYHYLISRGAVYDSFNPSTNMIEYSRTITLPADFKNKDYTIALSLRTFGTDDAYGNRTTDYTITAQELTYGVFDRPNGKFSFNARFVVKRIETGVPVVPYEVGFTIEYLAVV